MKLVYCALKDRPMRPNKTDFFVNCGFVEYSCNVKNFCQVKWWTNWSKRFDPESVRFITPLTDENIADFIAAVVVQQPPVVYISIDRDDTWKTEEGKKLLKALEEACKD